VNHGIQLWAALPPEHEESAPSFVHTPAQSIPQLRVQDATVRVLIGRAWGATSPVESLAPALYLDIQLPAHGRLELPSHLAQEIALYVVDAAVSVSGATLEPHTMAVMPTDQSAILLAGTEPVRCMLLGGDALKERRHIWWNFVSTRKERIVQAAEDWDAQHMGQVPGETEWIPLPPQRFKP
jgi:redox-sensitive bicupin YhaK (pirin superfamily)